VMLVVEAPGNFILYDVGAMSFHAFRSGRKALSEEVARKLYDEVLFVQEIVAGDNTPTPGTALDPDVPTEIVAEEQYQAGRYLRISRLKH